MGPRGRLPGLLIGEAGRQASRGPLEGAAEVQVPEAGLRRALRVNSCGGGSLQRRCQHPVATRMYQLQCQAGLGTAQAGPGWLDLPAVGGGSRGVGHTQDGTPPGARAPWLQRAGATGSDAGTQTHTRSRKAGSACSRAPGEEGKAFLPPRGKTAV
ncbi:hypothetical protein J1605_014997 [Eschrichtius robustus]|uniref:Uncharacterized protein n=1 Tax=Eschrichtius robustus TaxID=9764 RepID=A0AB34GBY2_ESCRO|nr:hypothetical protein J1605_014997 [Eschrichtius robustus]